MTYNHLSISVLSVYNRTKIVSLRAATSIWMWRPSQSYGQDVETISELWSGCGDHLRAMARMWKPSQSYGQDVETGILELWSAVERPSHSA